MQLKCSPAEIRDWLSIPTITTPEAIRAWQARGLRAEEALRWNKLLGSLEEAEPWRQIGCGPREAAKWIALDRGMYVAEVFSWKQAGDCARRGEGLEACLARTLRLSD